MEDGFYTTQHCVKCGYDWDTLIITLPLFFEELWKSETNKNHIIADKFGYLKTLNIFCPECGSNDTIWSLAIKAVSRVYSPDEITVLKTVKEVVNESMKI